jgi:adenosylhomocysteine nucleosidase
MSRAAIIASLPGELKPLVRGWRRELRSGVALWRSGDGAWLAACAGAGTAAAGRALAEIEKDGPIGLIVNTGWAGALRPEFAAGRAYGVSGVIDGRTGERFALAVRTPECWLVTSQRVADRPEKQRLAAAFGAGLVDMEAAEIARLAAARGIPFWCVKGVSDGDSDQIPDFNGFIAANGEFQLVGFIRFALRRPALWPALVRLGRNSRRAARAIRPLVLAILGSAAGERGGGTIAQK